MYDWIHSNFDITDHEIAKRMLDLSNPKGVGDIGIYKGWLSHIKKGTIADSAGYRIWLLYRTLEGINDFSNEMETENIRPHAILAAKLHSVVTNSFLSSGICDSNNFKMVGCNFFSYLLLSNGNDYISPRRGIKHLDVKDITIDVLEILYRDEKTISHTLLESELSQLLSEMERLVQNYINKLSLKTLLQFKTLPADENKMRDELKSLKNRLHRSEYRKILTIKGIEIGEIKQYCDYYTKQTGTWFGKGVKSIGLIGNVKKNDFEKLLKYKGYKGKSQVMHDSNVDYFTAIELTFWNEDSRNDRTREEHKKAVEATLRYLENYHAIQTQGGPTYGTDRKLAIAIFEDILYTRAVIMDITQYYDVKQRVLSIADLYDRLRDVENDIENRYRQELAVNLTKQKEHPQIIDNEDDTISDAMSVIHTWFFEGYSNNVIKS